MYLQRPVVVTDIGGLREMVEEGVTGRVVPPGDPARSRPRSSPCSTTRRGPRDGGPRARGRAQKYTVTAMVDAYERAYRSLVRTAGQKRRKGDESGRVSAGRTDAIGRSLPARSSRRSPDLEAREKTSGCEVEDPEGDDPPPVTFTRVSTTWSTAAPEVTTCGRPSGREARGAPAARAAGPSRADRWPSGDGPPGRARGSQCSSGVAFSQMVTAAPPQEPEVLRVRHDAAARRQDRALAPGDQGLQRFPFPAAVGPFPVQLEDLRERQPGRLLDPPVQLDEPDAEPLRERAADRALPRPAQSEQRHERRTRGSREKRRGDRAERRGDQCEAETEGFPLPPSTCARKRSESPTRDANSLRLQPLCARRCGPSLPSQPGAMPPASTLGGSCHVTGTILHIFLMTSQY